MEGESERGFVRVSQMLLRVAARAAGGRRESAAALLTFARRCEEGEEDGRWEQERIEADLRDFASWAGERGWRLDRGSVDSGAMGRPRSGARAGRWILADAGRDWAEGSGLMDRALEAGAALREWALGHGLAGASLRVARDELDASEEEEMGAAEEGLRRAEEARRLEGAAGPGEGRARRSGL